MKKLLPAILLLIAFITHVIELRSQSYSAEEILTRSIAAMGGKAKLQSIQTISYNVKGHEYMLEQSERPEGPYYVSYFSGAVSKNLPQQKCLYTLRYESNQRPYRILVQGDKVAAVAGANLLPMYPESDELLFLAPEQILLLAASTKSTFIKDTPIHGIKNHLLVSTLQGYPVRILINSHSFILTGIEISRYYSSNFAHAWGDSKKLYLFSFWHLDKNGISLPYQTDIFLNGKHFRTTTIDSVRFNQPVAADSVSINDTSYTKMLALKKRIDPNEPPILNAKEIYPGIQFLPGNWNTLLVKTNEGIVVLEAPVSSNYSAVVMGVARKLFPTDQVKAVISTSDAWMHIAGLRHYMAAGKPIYTHHLNVAINRQLAAAHYNTYPDSLSKKRPSIIIKPVSEKTTVGSGTNAMIVYPMHGASSERMMIVYFPALRLLYTSDLVQPSKNKFFMPQYLHELIRFVSAASLNVDKIVGMHLPLTDYATVTEFLRGYMGD